VKIVTDLENFNVKNPVLTVGTFDGVHLGHQKLINNLKKSTKDINGSSVVFTFTEHPRKILNPEIKLDLLHSAEEKRIMLQKMNIDYAIFLNFTKEFSQLTAFEFVEKVLVQKLKIKKLILGYNHLFGKDRLGNFENVQYYAKMFGFELEKIDAELDNDIAISSTKIRNYIVDGNIKLANKFLGYEYFLKGTVIEGNKIGRTFGFPTANISYSNDKLLPSVGVYAVTVEIENKKFNGMANIGFRPTIEIDNRQKTVEVNIFDFDEDIYNKVVIVNFIDRIRNEKKFQNTIQLKQQLNKDKVVIINLLKEEMLNTTSLLFKTENSYDE